MRAVILAGGKGTRMSPCTKITNKHLLPVYSKEGAIPMIYYPLRTLVRSGIEDILIITSSEHCGHIIETLKDGHEFGANLSYKIQDHERVVLGIASALKIARNFTNDEPFAVILGDNYFEDNFKETFQNFEKSEFEATVFLKSVDEQEIRRFGCASIEENNVTKIVEKPISPESNWAVTGLYLYKSNVYKIAETLRPSNRGELEITDINNYFCQSGKLLAGFVHGFWSDMGTPESIKKTQNFLEN